MSTPPLIGKKVRLRPWQTTDVQDLLAVANNPKVAAKLRDRFPSPYTLADAQEWTEFASQQTPVTNFAIEFEGRAVGGIGLVLGEDIHCKTAELGYWLGEPYWGRGLISEAVQLITTFAFATFDLHRLWASPFAGNTASERVLLKSGFALESVQRKAVFKNGQVLDQAICAIVK